MNKTLAALARAIQLKTSTAIQFLIISIFAALICLSPSINIIPKTLIITNFHDSQRLLELLVIILALLHAILFKNYISYFSGSRLIHYALQLIITIAIGSSYLAQSPRHAMIEVSSFVGLAYFSLFITNLYNEHNTLLIKRLTYVFWASICIYMVSFYVGYITATIFKTPVTWPAPLTGFNNVRSFNQYQLWSLGLITLPLLAFDFKGPYTRLWLHLGLIAWSILLFYSASRGALLAWIIGTLITGTIYRKFAWPFIRLQLINITAGFVGYKILFELIPTLRSFTVVTGTIIRDTSSDRMELWIQAIKLVQNHPFFGVGPMHFAWYSHTNAHPHNSVLQLLSEWGVPATLLILTITGYSLIGWLKRKNINQLQCSTKLNRNLAVVLFFTVITNALYSLVDGVIIMPISQIMMFTFLGLMIGFYNDGHWVKVKERSLFTPILASMMLITLIWSTFPEILQSATGNEKRFSIGYTASGPRFWLELK